MRMDKILLEKVGCANLCECGIGCLTNRKHQGFQPKTDWLKQRFTEGLRFLLFRDGEGRPLGFLEYVPGEYAWRPVDASGWLFVHCTIRQRSTVRPTGVSRSAQRQMAHHRLLVAYARALEGACKDKTAN
jgi:hypothetical protein